MSSFIQHQTKELADYSNGTRGVGGGGGNVGQEAAKNHDRLTDQLFTD